MTEVERYRVLVVDDQDMLVAAANALLETSGELEVVGTAWNGEEAVRLAAELAPDVVVMDIDMPVLDGVEATRQIVAASPAPRVLILSGLYERHRIDLALRAGATTYVAKDRMGDDLVETVLAVARGETLDATV